MDKYGIDLNPHIDRNVEFEIMLVEEVSSRYAEFILTAIEQIGRKQNVMLPMELFVGSYLTGCYVNYSRRESRLDFIQYPAYGKRGGGPYAKRIQL